MPHIELGNDEAGVRSLFMYRPETAYPMRMLAEVLLRGPSTLTRGERELIATYVSSRNGCSFCTASHAACASVQLPEGMTLIDQVRAENVATAREDAHIHHEQCGARRTSSMEPPTRRAPILASSAFAAGSAASASAATSLMPRSQSGANTAARSSFARPRRR